jgi:hypothetical protein
MKIIFIIGLISILISATTSVFAINDFNHRINYDNKITLVEYSLDSGFGMYNGVNICNPTNDPTYDPNSDHLRYIDEFYGISILYPCVWQKVALEDMSQQNPNSPLVVGFISPPNIDGDPSMAFVVIGVFELKSGTLDQLVNGITNEMEQASDIELLDSIQTTLAGYNPAQGIVYQVSGDPDFADGNAKILNLYTQVNDRVYKIIYKAGTEYYDNHFPIVENMINSIQFTDGSDLPDSFSTLKGMINNLN